MGENRHQTSSKLGLKNTGGEIVEVQGGHIVRSTGRKDRHSKVCTSKGPRDRRVRLSAHTAIQFYDVQDRLGFDRPSKAVDWLIKKAKAAIDELAELPAWHPTATTLNTVTQGQEEEEEEENRRLQLHRRQIAGTETVACSGYAFEQHLNNSSSFLPPSLDSDSIADTIKSFFPMTAATQTPSIHFQNQNYSPELLSRSNSHAQDLRLSLQSFQDPMLLHHSTPTPSEQTLFSGSTPLTFDSNSGHWSEQHQQSPEMDRFQRMVAWNSGAEQASGGGFFFNSPPLLLQPLLGQNQLFFQRGPLQSSNSPSVRAWTDSPIAITDHLQTPPIYPSSISGFGFASGGGFRIPARIQGEEEQDAISNKQSSASSASRH